MYTSQITKAESYLTGLSEQGRKRVATMLVMACNYGAGDALAGSILKEVPHSFIVEVCKVLKIEPCPKTGGMNGALAVLSGRSAIPEVEKLLTILDRSATAGHGPQWNAEWAQKRSS